MAATCDHGISGALSDRQIRAVADTAHQGAEPLVAFAQRRHRLDPNTGQHPRSSTNQRRVNTTHARVARDRPSESTSS